MAWTTDGEPRLRALGAIEGHAPPGAASVLAVSDDAGIAAMACGQGLDVVDLRTGALAFATSRGKKILAGLRASADGSVVAGFANLSEKTKRLVVYRRGPRGYRGERLDVSLTTGPSLLTSEANLALTRDGARLLTLEKGTELMVIDTTSGAVVAQLPLGTLSARGGPTPSGSWWLTGDGRLWTVHPAGDGASDLVCRTVDDGREVARRRLAGHVVIEDESPSGRLALLAPRSPWAQREPLAEVIVVDAEGHELHRAEARDGALRFEGDDALWSIPARPHVAAFQVAHEDARRVDLGTGAVVAMPGAAAVARVTSAAAIARGVLGDTLLVTDGQSLWELAPDGAARATHTCGSVTRPTPRVHLAVRGDRVLVVADRDGAHRSAPTVDPTTVVTTFAVI